MPENVVLGQIAVGGGLGACMPGSGWGYPCNLRRLGGLHIQPSACMLYPFERAVEPSAPKQCWAF
jgi:hypothetical protein